MSTFRRRDRTQRNTPRPDNRAGSPTEVPAPLSPAVLPSIILNDPFRVQPADPTTCGVTGCPTAAIPEMWETVDLDTGNELPLRLCEEHQLAYLRAPRPATPETSNPDEPDTLDSTDTHSDTFPVVMDDEVHAGGDS